MVLRLAEVQGVHNNRQIGETVVFHVKHRCLAGIRHPATDEPDATE